MRSIQELKDIQITYNAFFKSLEGMINARSTLKNPEECDELFRNTKDTSIVNLSKLYKLINIDRSSERVDLDLYRTILVGYNDKDLKKLKSDLELMCRIKLCTNIQLLCTEKENELTISEVGDFKCPVICLGTDLNNFAYHNQQYSGVVESIQLLLMYASLKYSHLVAASLSPHPIIDTKEYQLAQNLFNILNSQQTFDEIKTQLESVLKTARLEMSDDRTLYP